MKKILLITILVVLVLLGAYSWTSYNALVTIREAATAQWQQVETQYQRRFDLVPALVGATKGVLVQEQKVFGDIADARTRYSGAQTVNDKIAATNQMESALSRLLVVVENYPTLKSSDTVRDLMTQLEGTENRISTERVRFNDAVKVYETTIKRFPKNIFAGMFGFSDLEYFQADQAAATAPKVELN